MELLQIIYLTFCIHENEAMGLNRLAKNNYTILELNDEVSFKYYVLPFYVFEYYLCQRPEPWRVKHNNGHIDSTT